MRDKNKMKPIIGKDAFLEKYRSLSTYERRGVWILLFPTEGPTMYIQKFRDWPKVIDYLKEHSIRLDKIGLQYKTNTIEYSVKKSDGVYISQTVRGNMGGNTIECFSLGFAKEGVVYRTLYSTPDLTPDVQLEDNIEEVLQEALLIYDTEENRKKQIQEDNH
jgi:hypothetical protein